MFYRFNGGIEIQRYEQNFFVGAQFEFQIAVLFTNRLMFWLIAMIFNTLS